MKKIPPGSMDTSVRINIDKRKWEEDNYCGCLLSSSARPSLSGRRRTSSRYSSAAFMRDEVRQLRLLVLIDF